MKKETKDKTIMIRLTQSDFDSLFEIKKRSGITVSDMIRSSIEFYKVFYSNPVKQ